VLVDLVGGEHRQSVMWSGARATGTFGTQLAHAAVSFAALFCCPRPAPAPGSARQLHELGRRRAEGGSERRLGR